MKTLNQVLIEGSLTRAAELRTVKGNVPLCSFSLAYNRSYRSRNEWKKETGFFDVTLWGATAKELAPRLAKGAHVLVVGRLRWEQWTDKAGAKRSRVTILANQVMLVGKNTGTATDRQPVPQARPAAGPEQRVPMTEYPRLRAELDQLMKSGGFDRTTVETVLAEAQRIPPRNVDELQALLYSWKNQQRKAS